MSENLWSLTSTDPSLIHADGRNRKKTLFSMEKVPKKS
jgi:hypothetical protein